MNQLKAFIADNLAGFSPKAFPVFLFSFLVCALLSYLLGMLYVRYGHSLSNRKAFARNFIVLAVTTMFIISVVKSSLALSLGLVGALSIVRFRSAIKEPQELTYLFLNIAIGLGCGAGLTILTIVAFAGVSVIIWFNGRAKTAAEEESQGLYLTVSSKGTVRVDTTAIVNAIKDHCSVIKLKRADEAADTIEVSFFVEIEDLDKLEKAKEGLKKLDPAMSITFMDNTRDF